MPQNKYAIGRYKLIDSILRKHNYVKTTVLVDTCKKELGYSVSPRTIQMDIKAMKYDLFLGYFAPIEYCTKSKAYYYTHTDFMITALNLTEKEFQTLFYLSNYLHDKIDPDYFHVFKRFVMKIQKKHLF